MCCFTARHGFCLFFIAEILMFLGGKVEAHCDGVALIVSKRNMFVGGIESIDC